MSQVAEKAASDASGPKSRSGEIARQGITTVNQFTGLMSSLMSEVLSGEVAPVVCNAVVNAGGKMLKAVEMQYRYGVPLKDGAPRELSLCRPAGADADVDATAVAEAARRERIRRLEAELEAARAEGPERPGV